MRITADNTIHAPGTVITDTPEYRVTARGTFTIGRTTYVVRELHYPTTGNSELEMIGPRRSVYMLQAIRNSPGVYRAISWNTGQAWRRQGNEVRVIALGDIFEAATASIISRNARADLHR